MLSTTFVIEIDRAKLTGYLLNLQHPDGGTKAKFFIGNGYSTESEMRTLLLTIINTNPVKQGIQTEFGAKYIVEGLLPGKEAVMLRIVWVVLHGENCCRFVTAYPL